MHLFAAKSPVPNALDLAGGREFLEVTSGVGTDHNKASVFRRYVCCCGTPAWDSPPKMTTDLVVSSYPIELYMRGGGEEPEIRADKLSHCNGGTGMFVLNDWPKAKLTDSNAMRPARIVENNDETPYPTWVTMGCDEGSVDTERTTKSG